MSNYSINFSNATLRSHTIRCPFVILMYFSTILFSPLYACGWWGDGEVNRDENDEVTATYNRPTPQTLSLETTKLPGTIGHGIAVPEPSRAVPYLQATYGRHINRISEFKSFGFDTIIDLGTPREIATFHRIETEDAGMRYINIPIEGAMPSRDQVEDFSLMVVRYSRSPLLVYSPTSDLLGTVWASHRANLGTPLELAINEGRALGMKLVQEIKIRKWFESKGT